MLIIVASSNIFRRELSSYILGEAGYAIGEARTIEALLQCLRSEAPGLIVLDAQIEDADPGATLRAIRLLSEAPIMWIASGAAAQALRLVDTRPAAFIGWPYRAEELTSEISALLGRARAALVDPNPHERYAGSAE
jgi:DNA-binding response OmpR family regulator